MGACSLGRAGTALRRLCTYGLLFAASMGSSSAFFVLTAPSAEGANFTYDRARAVAFSDTNWNRRDPRFPYYGATDCTNFVSQNIFDGLIPEDLQWRHLSNIATTPAWNQVAEFVSYNAGSRTLNGHDFATLYRVPTPWSTYTTGYPADAVAYNWNNGGDAYDHLSLIVGIEYVGTYHDPYTGRQHIYNTYLDVVNSHSNDRYHMPWNYGYWNVYDTKIPAEQSRANGMIFQAIMINNV